MNFVFCVSDCQNVKIYIWKTTHTYILRQRKRVRKWLKVDSINIIDEWAEFDLWWLFIDEIFHEALKQIIFLLETSTLLCCSDLTSTLDFAFDRNYCSSLTLCCCCFSGCHLFFFLHNSSKCIKEINSISDKMTIRNDGHNKADTYFNNSIHLTPPLFLLSSST